MPDLPRDLTDLGDKDLMIIFSEFVAWQNYAATEFAGAEVTEERAESSLKSLEAQRMIQNWQKEQVTVAKARLSADPEVERARGDLLDAYAQRKLHSVIYANCERCANVISRELSRRIGRDGTERRNNRWTP